MNGGSVMEVVRTKVNASLLAPIISIPASMLGKDVEVTITESKGSIVDKLYGIAANLDMSLSDIRDERLGAK